MYEILKKYKEIKYANNLFKNTVKIKKRKYICITPELKSR